MKKSLLLFIFVIILIVPFLKAADTPQTPSIPSTSLTEINPDTGLPKSLEQFQKIGNNLSDAEKRKEFLEQDWTKLFAENKFLSPILFYTNKVFTIFNPLWNIIFGVEFSWSWFFILSLSLWVFLIIIIYNPLRLSISTLISVISSIIISSALGFFKVISWTVTQLTSLLSNIWFTLGFLILLIIISMFYMQLFKNMKEKQEKSEEQFNRQKLKRDVKIADRFSKAISG